MTNGKDRRIARTQQSIRRALLALMTRKSYRDISVSELAELADIGRGTFYSHYSDIFEVVQELENELASALRGFAFAYFERGSEYGLEGLLRDALAYIGAHEAEFRAFLLDAGSDFSKRLEGELYEAFYFHDLKYRRSASETARKYGVTCRLSGFCGAIRRWFSDGCRESPEELSALLAHLSGE